MSAPTRNNLTDEKEEMLALTQHKEPLNSIFLERQYKRVTAVQLSLKCHCVLIIFISPVLCLCAGSSLSADYYVIRTLNSFAVMTSQDIATGTANEPAL